MDKSKKEEFMKSWQLFKSIGPTILSKIEEGQTVEESESYIDKKHLEYWDECIDESYHPVDMDLEENLIAPIIDKVIQKK